MSTLENAKQQIVAMLSAALPDVPVAAAELVQTPNREMGDLAFACFGAAKALKKNPAQVAKDVAAALTPKGLIAKAAAAGPYVNFFFDRKSFSAATLDEMFAAPDSYGVAPPREERILIEYAQPNTHKELHVGHLRNLCLGLAVVNLCRAAGYDAVPMSYIGDIGAHVAKCLWAFKKIHHGKAPASDRGKFLGQVYAEASRLVEENPAYKEEIAEVQRKLEARDKEWDKLWKETRRWSLDEFKEVFAELGAHFDKEYFESDVEEAGKKLVRELVKKGIAKTGEGGALIVDFESEGLGVFLVLKSDGSALYSTKELALAEKKFADYPDAVASVHVVDTRQALYFKQFFATLRRMGFKKAMTHLAYEFVTLKEGAMSSRKGNIVTYEDFRDEVRRRATEETGKRRDEWDADRIRATARDIADAAMKFGMLKQDIDKAIVFDIDAALSFDGYTGPYVQYAHARLSSILAKTEDAHAAAGTDDEREYALVRAAADFPHIVADAARDYRPSLLCQYLFEFAQAANGFYRDVPVLNADHADRARRLAIVAAARTVLRRGLGILGIAAPEEM